MRCHHDLWRNDIESHETAPAGHDDTKALEFSIMLMLFVVSCSGPGGRGGRFCGHFEILVLNRVSYGKNTHFLGYAYKQK